MPGPVTRICTTISRECDSERGYKCMLDVTIAIIMTCFLNFRAMNASLGY